jgi:hypothetical protein
MRRVRIRKERKPPRRAEDIPVPELVDRTQSHRQGRQLVRQLEDLLDELDELLASATELRGERRR